ncbi:MAG TPA: outer membrane protein transport protein [Gammaproteobacteria bacterium]|nr:outer membrane protein transport protein [Gammaproteobacteria bacterium]
MNKIITAFVCLIASGALQAGGYRVATQGQKALAMGHTGVAMTDSSEVVFFNPGAMTRLEANTDFTAGITLLEAETEYLNQDTLVDEKTDNALGTPIDAYYTRKYNQQISWGLGIYTPFGNKVKWPTDWVGSHLVNEIELQAIYIQPTIGYQINDKTSVGIGPNMVVGAVKFNRNLSTSLTDADGNRSNVTIKADNVIAWGFNLGLLHQLNDKTDLGISYRSEVTVEARGGDADFKNIPTALESTFADGEFDADLPLPAELTVGVAYKYSNDLTLAFDINHTFWDVYDELVINFDNGITSENPRNYQDANVYRFGLQYRYSDKWTLRGGIYFDESPVPDGYFAPETPRNDSIGYTAGATYRYSKNLELDFSLLILTFDQTTNSYDYYEEGGFTIPFGGTYDSAANSIGFGLSYKY